MRRFSGLSARSWKLLAAGSFIAICSQSADAGSLGRAAFECAMAFGLLMWAGEDAPE